MKTLLLLLLSTMAYGQGLIEPNITAKGEYLRQYDSLITIWTTGYPGGGPGRSCIARHDTLNDLRSHEYFTGDGFSAHERDALWVPSVDIDNFIKLYLRVIARLPKEGVYYLQLGTIDRAIKRLEDVGGADSIFIGPGTYPSGPMWHNQTDKAGAIRNNIHH